MVKLNKNFEKLNKDYLFQEIQNRVLKKGSSSFLNLGIGDITLPIAPSIINGICKAIQAQAHEHTLKGYGPSQGELLLRKAIKEDYKNTISEDEIFISSGTKNDISQIQEIFDRSNTIAITDPTYPVYVDSNVIAGRTKKIKKNGTYGGLFYLPCLEENGFLPDLPSQKTDIIYLCSPNNPTGAVLNKDQLKKWVDYALKNNSIILFDGAYESFITSKNIPRSIFEIDNAKRVAIEFRSFSKSAGFTGLRLSYYIVCKELIFDKSSLHAICKRRADTKYGGTSYPIQMGALEIFTPKGQEEVKKNINHYQENARILKEGLKRLGFKAYGGIDSPFIWCKTNGSSSWDFFDLLLDRAIICVPGRGFGPSGEGFVRFSAFAKRDHIIEALDRLKKIKV